MDSIFSFNVYKTIEVSNALRDRFMIANPIVPLNSESDAPVVKGSIIKIHI